MSLETILAGNNVNSFYGKRFFKRVAKIEGSEYFKYRSNNDDINEFCVGPDGKITYGGPYYFISGFSEVSGRQYLFARKWGEVYPRMYREDGSVAFAGKNDFNTQFVTLGKTTYLELTSSDKNNRTYYRENGSIAFGGMHYHTHFMFNFEGRPYLAAKHKQYGPFKLYSEDGSVLKSFGKQFDRIHRDDEFGGKPFLLSDQYINKTKRHGWFSKEGVFYDNIADAALSVVKDSVQWGGSYKNFHDSCIRVVNMLEYEWDQPEFLKKLVETVQETNDRYLAQPQTLKKALNQLTDCLTYLINNPDEKMEFAKWGAK